MLKRWRPRCPTLESIIFDCREASYLNERFRQNGEFIVHERNSVVRLESVTVWLWNDVIKSWYVMPEEEQENYNDGDIEYDCSLGQFLLHIHGLCYFLPYGFPHSFIFFLALKRSEIDTRFAKSPYKFMYMNQSLWLRFGSEVHIVRKQQIEEIKER